MLVLVGRSSRLLLRIDGSEALGQSPPISCRLILGRWSDLVCLPLGTNLSHRQSGGEVCPMRFSSLVLGIVAVLLFAAPVAAAGQVVVWTGSGASGGFCNAVSGSGSNQSWTFRMNQPFDASGSTLTAQFDEGETEVNASLTTNFAGANNDLVLTAHVAGAAGNAISVEFVAPVTADQPLQITVLNDTDVVVTLATNFASNLSATASQVVAALNAHPQNPVSA